MATVTARGQYIRITNYGDTNYVITVTGITVTGAITPN